MGIAHLRGRATGHVGTAHGNWLINPLPNQWKTGDWISVILGPYPYNAESLTQLREILRILQTCNVAEPDVRFRQPPRRSTASGSTSDAKATQPATTTGSGTTPSDYITTPAAAKAADAPPPVAPTADSTPAQAKAAQEAQAEVEAKERAELEARAIQKDAEVRRKKQQLAQEMARNISEPQEVRNKIFNKFLRQYHPDKNQESELATDIAHTVILFLLSQRELYLKKKGEYVDVMTPKAKAKPRPKTATPPRWFRQGERYNPKAGRSPSPPAKRARMVEDELLGLYEAALLCANGCGRRRRKGMLTCCKQCYSSKRAWHSDT